MLSYLYQQSRAVLTILKNNDNILTKKIYISNTINPVLDTIRLVYSILILLIYLAAIRVPERLRRTLIRGLKLRVYEALSYECMRPEATSV